MRTLEQTSLKELYHQALADPSRVGEHDLLQLILKYPYSQPLRFAYEKRQFLDYQELPNISSTLLYASSPIWLFEYITRPIIDFSGIVHFPEIADAIVEEETTEVTSGDFEVSFIEEAEVLALEPTIVTEEPANADDQALKKLIDGAATASSYFSVDTELSIDTLDSFRSTAKAPTNKEEDQARVSIYNDDLMPYSFQWWLNKTRLEYADTYQPYANPVLPKVGTTQKVVEKMAQHLDAQTLDQQIKENIFHLQEPESKLGEEFKQTIPFQVQKKTDEVIEKFIREDPQIKPPQPDKINTENKARKSSEDQFSLVTETLARIYAEQGLFPKAIEVYRKLILKIPEKNSYFAKQISDLEKKLN